MPNSSQIVINTSPLIAIVAAMGDFHVLQYLYTNVFVPFEVCQEIQMGGTTGLAVNEFQADVWLQKQTSPVNCEHFAPFCYVNKKPTSLNQ
jgi:predicted nucleic acid-binding protein